VVDESFGYNSFRDFMGQPEGAPANALNASQGGANYGNSNLLNAVAA
jgi:hypothetical protein